MYTQYYHFLSFLFQTPWNDSLPARNHWFLVSCFQMLIVIFILLPLRLFQMLIIIFFATILSKIRIFPRFLSSLSWIQLNTSLPTNHRITRVSPLQTLIVVSVLDFSAVLPDLRIYLIFVFFPQSFPITAIIPSFPQHNDPTACWQSIAIFSSCASECWLSPSILLSILFYEVDRIAKGVSIIRSGVPA